MEEYKKSFINFMVDSHVLKFGEFTLKSGRKSPFFMNAGAYKTGSQLLKLGEYYAKAINDKFGLEFDVLFGPAYKGIPLAVATVMAISKLYGRDIKYCANRKEIKDHGDKGILLGTRLHDEDRVMIIEDVTTSGASDEKWDRRAQSAPSTRSGKITVSRPARLSPWTKCRSISITGRSTAKFSLTKRSRNLLTAITRNMA